eukprot:TRINITY_DN15777_c0_g1_i2.p1 TRINITY_DN15777_c0_g1~~TRINITY_DN15777_c0_g1_i2.p1  ORF type:complete len:310 (+),score=62.53 TRINITY_DN15777_c0_g1_i2:63-992(+)
MTQRMGVVLLGKTGLGKSTTANKLLGTTAFKESSSEKSCTDSVDFARGRDFLVLDTPGFDDVQRRFENHINSALIVMKINDLKKTQGFDVNCILWFVAPDTVRSDERAIVQKIGLINDYFERDVWNFLTVVFNQSVGDPEMGEAVIQRELKQHVGLQLRKDQFLRIKKKHGSEVVQRAVRERCRFPGLQLRLSSKRCIKCGECGDPRVLQAQVDKCHGEMTTHYGSFMKRLGIGALVTAIGTPLAIVADVLTFWKGDDFSFTALAVQEVHDAVVDKGDNLRCKLCKQAIGTPGCKAQEKHAFPDYKGCK